MTSNLFQFILIFCYCFSTTLAKKQLTEEEKKIVEKFRINFVQCNQNTGLKLDPEGNTTQLIENSIKKNEKCWRKCYLQATGMVDNEGKMILKNVTKHVANLARQSDDAFVASNAESIVQTCQTMKVEDDPCQAAPDYFRCIAVNMDRLSLYGVVQQMVVAEMDRRFGPELKKRLRPDVETTNTPTSEKISDAPDVGGYKGSPPLVNAQLPESPLRVEASSPIKSPSRVKASPPIEPQSLVEASPPREKRLPVGSPPIETRIRVGSPPIEPQLLVEASPPIESPSRVKASPPIEPQSRAGTMYSSIRYEDDPWKK